MNTRLVRFANLLSLSLLLLAPSRVSAKSQSADWNVAVLDKILDNLSPYDRTAAVGDMDIRVTDLKAWRDRLAGEAPFQLELAGSSNAPTWTAGNVYYNFTNVVAVTNLIPSTNSTFLTNVVHVTNVLSAAHQKVFLDAAREWAMFANLHFFPRTNQANFITVGDDNSGVVGEGGRSAVGMIGGEQFLLIGASSWIREVICHELGHALGLVHEHQRLDRDDYVTVLTNNIVPGLEPQLVKIPTSRTNTPYDFLSIMHYAHNAFSVNPGLDTIVPLPAYSQYIDIMGVRFDPVLSVGDRAGMAAIYGVGPPTTNIVTTTQDSGPGSLRAAFYYAFDHPGTTITFNIPANDPGKLTNVFLIQPTDQLPSLVNGTTLDGATQLPNPNPNGPAIELNGILLPTLYEGSGVRLAGSNCTVRSLIINGFPGSGVLIDGTNAAGNVVSGCYLGVDPTGAFSIADGLNCVTISHGAHGNTVGGSAAGFRNIISGSLSDGLVITDPGTSDNVVSANFVGLNAKGTAPLPNGSSGIRLGNGAQGNQIGGTTPQARNVISGNALNGIFITDANTTGNLVVGNYLGVNPTGTGAVPNGRTGVSIGAGANNNLIGGPSAGAGNLICGNGTYGVALGDQGTQANSVQGNYIGLGASGTNAVPNASAGIVIFDGANNNLIGGTDNGAANIISGNANSGVLMSGTNVFNNLVRGNYIGLNASGNGAVPNAAAGVALQGGAASNTVGGESPLMRNIIAGNQGPGVAVRDTNTTANVVAGNFIGLNAAGKSAVPNTAAGVSLFAGARSNVIGGFNVTAANVISGNSSGGVTISDAGTTANLIEGNLIGVDPTGATALPNQLSGVAIFGGAQSNLIGGTIVGAGNVISGNTALGINISDAGTMFNLVQGNLIGLNAAGNKAVPNLLSGITIFLGAQSNIVGGASSLARNVISGNISAGIVISDANTSGNIVAGNYVGLDTAGGIAISNLAGGIDILGGAQGNLVGGTMPGAGNVISGNGYPGIVVSDLGTSGNMVAGNFIGLDATGVLAVANESYGITILNGAQSNQIGGVGVGYPNFISGNHGFAISLYGTNTANNVIQGNKIGLNAANGSVANTSGGLVLFNGTHSNTIGGTTPGAGNLIAYNQGDGVQISGAGTVGNTVRGNSIFSNAGLSIDLFSGGNNDTAPPSLTSGPIGANFLVGSLLGILGNTVHIDFYTSPIGSAAPQAKTYLGSKDFTAGLLGALNFSVTLAPSLTLGQNITATATDLAGNTSPLAGGIALAPTDSVGDGIADGWRKAHFGGTGTTTNAVSCAACDPDHDGMTNLQEFQTGSDPNDPTSALRITALPDANGAFTVGFDTLFGLRYLVEARDELGSGNWSVIADQITGSGDPVQLSDPGAVPPNRRFYRLAVLVP